MSAQICMYKPRPVVRQGISRRVMITYGISPNSQARRENPSNAAGGYAAHLAEEPNKGLLPLGNNKEPTGGVYSHNVPFFLQARQASTLLWNATTSASPLLSITEDGLSFLSLRQICEAEAGLDATSRGIRGYIRRQLFLRSIS